MAAGLLSSILIEEKVWIQLKKKIQIVFSHNYWLEMLLVEVMWQHYFICIITIYKQDHGIIVTYLNTFS